MSSLCYPPAVPFRVFTGGVMFRRPTFWVVIVGLAAASTWFDIASFSRAFPIVSLDITMDRATEARLRALCELRG
jgi:hypothetical protein